MPRPVAGGASVCVCTLDPDHDLRRIAALTSPISAFLGDLPMPRKKARVLVIEDETLVSIGVEDTLLAAGYEVVGPIGCLELAIDAAAEAQIDIALIDIDLHGMLSTPAIRALRARRIPFA